jgi:hypothetical protein
VQDGGVRITATGIDVLLPAVAASPTP